MPDRVCTRNLGFGSAVDNWDLGLRQVEQGFSSFIANFFLANLRNFQTETLKMYQKIK